LGESSKAKSNREKFVRGASKTYEKAKRSDYVKECRTGVQQKKREWNRKMPSIPPPREQEEGVPRPRLTQVWWLGNEILAVHHYLQRAHGELSEAILDIKNVKTHQFALISPDGGSVIMVPIRKNMPMSATTTKALAAAATVVPCMKEGENCFEDEDEWKNNTMEDHSVADMDRQDMVHEARQGAGASNGGRKSLRGDAGREQDQIGGAGTDIGKDPAAVVRAAHNGETDFAGWHGGSGASHARTTNGDLGELAGTR
jgi:hypothetical protein